jgi:hypothetical protein
MTDRATAAAVGALFLVGTAAGGIGLALQESVVGKDDYLAAAAAHPDRLATGVLLELVMGLAVVAIAVVIYPVLRRATERLAIAYVVARTVEAVIYILSGAGLLALITLGQKSAAAQDGTTYSAVGALVNAERDWVGNAILDSVVFTVGAIVLNYALYRAHLVPSLLSVWGMLGALAYLASGVLVLYGLEVRSTPQVVLEAPLALQELALGLWLILKGFTAPRGATTAPAEVDRSLPRPMPHAAA